MYKAQDILISYTVLWKWIYCTLDCSCFRTVIIWGKLVAKSEFPWNPCIVKLYFGCKDEIKHLKVKIIFLNFKYLGTFMKNKLHYWLHTLKINTDPIAWRDEGRKVKDVTKNYKQHTYGFNNKEFVPTKPLKVACERARCRGTQFDSTA
jgi:hypothetical protein